MSTKRNSDRRATTIRIWKGDVVLDDGARRLEVVDPPSGIRGGKGTIGMVRRDGDTSPHPAIWKAWRKPHVVRPSAV